MSIGIEARVYLLGSSRGSCVSGRRPFLRRAAPAGALCYLGRGGRRAPGGASSSTNEAEPMIAKLLACHAAIALGAAGLSAAEPQSRPLPNILLIVADDLGWGDLGSYNPASKIPTPHLDRLAAEGLRFTDAHSPAAVCVPTRYGLLTGRYPFRRALGEGPLIEEGRLTLGGLLRRRGYATAMVGKWHLGFEGEKAPRAGVPLSGGPIDRGFDRYFGIPSSLDIPPYYWIEGDRCLSEPTARIAASGSEGWTPIQGAFWRQGGIAPGFEHAGVLPRLAEKALEYLEDLARGAAGEPRQPFFLYVALTAPHTPWLPGESVRGKSGASSYGDFVHEVDALAGRLLGVLERRGIARDTLVIFTSDNGPTWYPRDVERFGHLSAGRLRGMKGDLWEGGHRVPFVARWPDRTPRAAVSDALICHTDLLASFAAIAGETLADDAGEDSFDFSPLLLGKEGGAAAREALILESSSRVLAVRSGPWKLIPQLGSAGFSEPRRIPPEPGGPRGQLYHLGDDPEEARNLFAERPELVSRLEGLLSRCRRDGRSRPR
jgi:arylsulfatase A-like enzyme